MPICSNIEVNIKEGRVDIKHSPILRSYWKRIIAKMWHDKNTGGIMIRTDDSWLLFQPYHIAPINIFHGFVGFIVDSLLVSLSSEKK